MSPQYEKMVLNKFTNLLEKDLIFRGHKPVFYDFEAG
jgi:isoleucyl-tRNA synthetase